MARLRQRRTTGQRVLVVDDGEDLRVSTARLLHREGFEVKTAADGIEAIELVRSWSPHVVLLDYLMPKMSGPEVVAQVRAFDSDVQIVLTTGYALDHPGRDMMREFDIQGYHDKSDGPQKLLVLLDAALKAYESRQTILRQANGLRQILEAGPDLHRLQPINKLLEQALSRALELTSSSHGLVTTVNAGLLVTRESDNKTLIRASAGEFSGIERVRELPEDAQALLDRVVLESTAQTSESFAAIPMLVADRCNGAILLERSEVQQGQLDLLHLFGSHVALALENNRLYELATVDSLTGLLSRQRVLERLSENLRLSVRNGQPLSIILVDLDRFKSVNDTRGHIAGDVVLSQVGACIQDTIRDTDFAGRYGGEEFLIVMPSTRPSGADQLAEKLRNRIETTRFRVSGDSVLLTASLGFGGFAQIFDGGALRDLSAPVLWNELSTALIHKVDGALYDAKAAGRNCVRAPIPNPDLSADFRRIVDRLPER